MEPADKIRARQDALAHLGLDPSANSDDIREAWRHIAFHAHPDHTEGDSSGFANAKAAYDLLRREGMVAKGTAGSAARKPRRPKIRKRVIELDATAIDACRDMLRNVLSQSKESDADPVSSGKGAQSALSDHIPEAVGCNGRHLTYFVTSSVCEGANRVALPTTVLAGCRHAETEVLSFQSKESGAGEVVVPDAIMARKFPGAKSVRIRFESNQRTRDDYCMAS